MLVVRHFTSVGKYLGTSTRYLSNRGRVVGVVGTYHHLIHRSAVGTYLQYLLRYLGNSSSSRHLPPLVGK